MLSTPSPFWHLSLDDLRLWVYLGCSAEERQNPQCVSFHVAIHFSRPPATLENDQIEGTVCYDQICNVVTQATQEKSFNTIEYLGQQIFSKVASFLEENNKNVSQLTVRIHKISPPVRNLHGGANFTCSGPLA